MPAGRPTSIYLEDKVMDLLTMRTSSSSSRSETFNAIVYRYDQLCRASLPPFERAEWLLLVDALNEALLRAHPASTPTTLLWLLVEDACKLTQADRKFRVDRQKFTEKLRDLKDHQAIAVFDAVERYWAAKDAGRPAPEDVPIR
jgi:hypothetical protein